MCTCVFGCATVRVSACVSSHTHTCTHTRTHTHTHRERSDILNLRTRDVRDPHFDHARVGGPARVPNDSEACRECEEKRISGSDGRQSDTTAAFMVSAYPVLE